MPWLMPIIGYLLGSIPTAYIACRLLKGKDIRQIGDGNVGAQNVFRQLGAKAGIMVGVIDAGKGAAAILLAQSTNLPQPIVLITGAMVVIGHNWPLFLRFHGGKGESTTIGVLLVVITQPMLVMAIPTIAALFILRNVTKASAILFIPLPLLCWWFGYQGIIVVYSMALPCLVGFTHFLRLRRLPVHQET